MIIRGNSESTNPQPQKSTAQEFLAENGILDVVPELDDKLKRHIHTCGPKKVAWAVFHSEPVPHGSMGCWRCGAKASWFGVDRELTKQELAAIKKASDKKSAEYREKQEKLSETLTEEIFPELQEAPPDHPYLVRKAIPPKGFKIRNGILIIPIQDENDQIWSAQGISDKPVWGKGPDGKPTLSKHFEDGGRITGCFFLLGTLKGAPNIVICEGAATAATIHKSTGLPVAAALSASNLVHVAKVIRGKHPKSILTIAGDNDLFTMGKTGKNPGIEESESAHLSVHGSSWVYPEFGNLPVEKDLSDFNDLARARGEEAVRLAFAAQIPPPRMELIFNGSNSSWWTLDEKGIYLPITEGVAARRLHIHGFKKHGEKSEPSAVEVEMDRIIHQEAVHYAGPLAGWPAGIHSMLGQRILVTKPCRLPMGAPGECETLNEIFKECLGPHQHWWTMAWLKLHRRRILTQFFHPMPALALIGAAQSGKSLLQEVFTRALGGRSAKPASYLQGKTEFNGNLFGAEHLAFEDESADASAEARRNLGEKIKEMLFCRTVNCRGMYQPAISLMPYWAMSMSINNAIEHIMVLPSIDDSLRDKISIVSVAHKKRPVPDGMRETEWIGQLLDRELPALIWAIDHDLPDFIHPDYADDRTQLGAIQDPIIMDQLNELSAESRFLTIVDDVLFAEDGGLLPWIGTQEQLTRRLKDSERRGFEASKLLGWSAACGSYLGKLAKRFPERISAVRKQENKVRGYVWTIEPPNKYDY